MTGVEIIWGWLVPMLVTWLLLSLVFLVRRLNNDKFYALDKELIGALMIVITVSMIPFLSIVTAVVMVFMLIIAIFSAFEVLDKLEDLLKGW